MRWWTLALWAAGCAGEEAGSDEPRSLVAQLDDAIHLGLVGDADKLTAYVCDGTPDGVNVSEWIEADVVDEVFTGASEGGVGLAGSFEGDSASGTVTLADGTALPFQADLNDDEGSGLFRGEADTEVGFVVAGWILQGQENQRGAVRNRTTQTLVTAQSISVIAVSVDITIDGLDVTLPVENYINAY